ncbi:MAG: hypothetical protein J7L83_02405 [Thaumarchaeota archaeon]|nr:hypothetical protein [Nitrososphaerota archaeon]
MGLPDDLLDRVKKLGTPGYMLPSDFEMIVKELMHLKAEIEKIKDALRKHGIKID